MQKQDISLEANVDVEDLSEAEARARLDKNGYNEILEEPSGPFRGILKRLWGPIPWTLEAALILEVALGKIVEASVIAVLLLFSAIVGETQELRAHTAVDFLRHRLQVSARVRRDGRWRFLPARELVSGDLVHIKLGDIVPADCIIRNGAVEVDQSVLTGESVSVSRSNDETIYSGSTVLRGEAIATVTATGSGTSYGRTAELVRTAESPGHLQKLMFTVVRYLATVDLVLAVVLVGVALWNNSDLLPLLPFLVVLVIATVPVSMPASFTVANALEARTLAKEGVLITGLTAIQEAATMEVLCVDKTGTLTQNRPEIAAIIPFPGELEEEVLAYAAACCDEATQNPLDIAILHELEHRSIQPLSRHRIVPFDPATKRSESYVNRDGQTFQVMLGSPPIVEQFADPRPEFKDQVEELAASGARVLAVAAGPEGHLSLRGLVALADLPREDAAALVKAIQGLGIRVLMVTGDTSATARAVSHKVNLGDRIGDLNVALNNPLEYDGFANVYPEDKFRIVQALQKLHLTTGMTGDGINDAPALKQAEVGIAVSSASDVAKASAKVVMTSPGLQDIVKIIYGGRYVYRRMLTWTITKIARTVELAVLLTLGYIATGFFVTPLSLIIIIIVLNDIVTITLGTDRAWASPVPERWDVRDIAKIAGILAAGWLVLAFFILWIGLNVLKLPVPQIQTLMFVYLIFSAQTTIYITRVRDHLWSFLPSRYVIATTVGNVVVASALAILGILMAAVPVIYLIGVLGAVLAATFLLDEVKIWFYQSTGILGKVK
ncbi:P-type ATPase [Methanocella paludicola SANAE]|uniref:P-type ATPase n=1 Tax=Methanocella paludicola (strain DSM 17711 / JCM 13418 / NBRC 101707 / SANAE) TaxID=304371 RepID=D1Z1G8_METPS|nr:plasma-membrane proton-efflux P-type ATPase [Methanocella paludicola]BAI62540.1 P-type ATPase [Methanocella paludicola SANAE]